METMGINVNRGKTRDNVNVGKELEVMSIEGKTQ